MDFTVVSPKGRYTSDYFEIQAFLTELIENNFPGEIIEIGRAVDTGPGEIGNCEPPLYGGFMPIPSGCGMPNGSETLHNYVDKYNFEVVKLKMSPNAGNARSGVFYFTAEHEGAETTIQTIKLPDKGTVHKINYLKIDLC